MHKEVCREHAAFERAKAAIEGGGQRAPAIEAMIRLAFGGVTPAKGWARQYLSLRLNTIVTTGDNDDEATQATG